MVSQKSTDAGTAPGLAQAVTAALAWWREAGVDGDFSDAPHDWLAKPAPKPAPKPTRAPAAEAPVAERQLAGGPANWPTELSAFAQWWLTQPDLAPPSARRLAPTGPPAPALMVVVPMPEADDTDTLLSGPAGRLLDGILAAAGLARDQVYCAAALPARIAAPDWTALAQTGLGQILQHHIALVQPRRLILFGQNGISTLIGNGLPINVPHLPLINHDGAGNSVLTAYDLETIAARPALKSGLWSRWLEWMPA